MLDRFLALRLVDALVEHDIDVRISVTTYPGEPDTNDGDRPGWSVVPTRKGGRDHLDIIQLTEVCREVGVAVSYSPASGFHLTETTEVGS